MPLEQNDTGGYKFTCDQCGAPDVVWINTLEMLVILARANGWKIDQSGDSAIEKATCPLCVSNPERG